MEKKSLFKDLKVSYQQPSKENWIGRKTSKPHQYWYQDIELKDITKEEVHSDVAILGYSCEEGVRRNQGRIGAKDAPNLIRKVLGKVAKHHKSSITDVGTIACNDPYLEDCQKALSNTVSSLLSQKVFPIVLGGGHDIAYGHFMGVWEHIKQENKKVGIINFDAHFDLRPVETTPNSGTPFNQIINELKAENQSVDYCAIGIQEQGNTDELFQIAQAEKVTYFTLEECFLEKERVKKQLSAFLDRNDYVYVTIDVDGFSSAYAPGVSAASPIGLTPLFVQEILSLIIGYKKLISCDFAETNPKYDRDSQTVNLVSKLVDFIVRKREE